MGKSRKSRSRRRTRSISTSSSDSSSSRERSYDYRRGRDRDMDRCYEKRGDPMMFKMYQHRYGGVPMNGMPMSCMYPQIIPQNGMLPPPVMHPQQSMVSPYCQAQISQPGMMQHMQQMPQMMPYSGYMMATAPYQSAAQPYIQQPMTTPAATAAPPPIFQFQITPCKGNIQPQGRR